MLPLILSAPGVYDTWDGLRRPGELAVQFVYAFLRLGKPDDILPFATNLREVDSHLLRAAFS
jgi:hypothetical protein